MNPKTTRNIRKLGLIFRKNIPNITTVISAIGVVGTAVLSAKAAYDSIEALEDHKKTIEKLHINKDNFDDPKEYNKEVFSVYKDTAFEMIKVYWPAALASATTMAAIFTTNSVHRKRYLAMSGMYSAILTAYNEYRNRVSKKYGEEAERELYYDLKREEIVTVETDKKGREKTKVEIVTKPGIIDDPTFSLFLIDQRDKTWYYKNPEMTYYRLTEIEKYLTQRLRTKGYLFLNEVLSELQKPEIPEGQIIGWVYDETKGDTDNCVDFGLKSGTENFDFFMNGKNDFVYITMNHDGTIYDKFPLFDRFRKRNPSRRV